MGSTDISSSAFASWARQLIKLITTLRALGAQADFDLPRIAVIGNQSAGKSSLVEAISGISVPRALGTCTRCPMECRLTNSDRPWQCQILLRRESDESGQRIPTKEDHFGPVIHDKSKLGDMIRRAQLAILNPGCPAESFVNFDLKSLSKGEKPAASPKQLAFSSNVVCLDLSGPDLPDLSFIDLPGIISTVEKGEDKENINAVRKMVEEHIEGNTLILLAITMRDDVNNQGAAHLAQLADPTGSRTIGVLTKPDLIQEGEEDSWLKILQGSSHTLKHGYFITKHPSPKELEEHVTHEQAREREATFFESTPPWSLKSQLRSRMGTPNLTKELSNLLGALISQSLPTLRANATESLISVKQSLESLPAPPPENPVLELMRMVNQFADEFKSLVRGIEGYERLLQQCRPAHYQLKYDILGTAPNFRPFKAAEEDVEDFHLQIDQDDALDSNKKRKRTDDTQPVYLQDVRARIDGSLTRQLPFNVPFSVKVSFIERCFDNWEKYCLRCFDAIQRSTEAELSNLAQKYFGKVGGAALISDVRMHCDDLVRKCHAEASKLIRLLLKMEDPPFTVNDHYFSACRDKYLAQFKAVRKPTVIEPEPALVQATLANLAAIGYGGLTVEDLGKLRKEDRYEEELTVMAESSAYFRVAYKRIIDNIPRAIDHAFIRAVAEELHDTLTVGLSLTSENSSEQAAFYLAEDLQTRADRKHLSQKKERLDAVLRELSRFEHTVSPAVKAASQAMSSANKALSLKASNASSQGEHSKDVSATALIANTSSPAQVISRTASAEQAPREVTSPSEKIDSSLLESASKPSAFSIAKKAFDAGAGNSSAEVASTTNKLGSASASGVATPFTFGAPPQSSTTSSQRSGFSTFAPQVTPQTAAPTTSAFGGFGTSSSQAQGSTTNVFGSSAFRLGASSPLPHGTSTPQPAGASKRSARESANQA